VAPVRAYVALGSNLGDRAEYLRLARERLSRLPETRLVAASAVEETEPLGNLPQPRYLNQMVALDTGLSARSLLAACLAIEAEAGRTRTAKWEPRTLDLDVVKYDDLTLTDGDLVLPHPGLADRVFWIRELDELRRNGY
jgi:2-amino-4-hydroxy-6-hydroxymethyldihydropteridine diphosphokinase